MREIAPGIVSDPDILGGRPTLKGRRITAAQLMGQLAGGMTMRELQDDYELRDEEVSALLAFAAQAVQEKEWKYGPRP